MGAGVIPNAYMVEELSDSTPDERHLDLRRLRKASEEVKRQWRGMLKCDFDTCSRCYGSTAGTHCSRVVSVDMHIGRHRAQEASK